MSDEQQVYWHIASSNDDGVPVLRQPDGREIRVGETLRVESEPFLCEHGPHACPRLLDTLKYATGTVICKVALGGTVIPDTDKAVAQERTVLAMTTAEAGERILREFARWCALEVAHLWDMPPVVRQFLETADSTLAQEVQSEAARVGSAVAAAEWAAWAAEAPPFAVAAAAAAEAPMAAAAAKQNDYLTRLVEAELSRS